MIPLLVWGNHHCSEASFRNNFDQLVKKQKRYNNPVYVENSPPALRSATASRVGPYIDRLGNGPTVHIFIYGDKEIHYDSTLSYIKSRYHELIRELERRPKSFAILCGVIPDDTFDPFRREAYHHFDHWLKEKAKGCSNILAVSVQKRLSSRHYDLPSHLNEDGQQVVAQSLAKALYCIPRLAFAHPNNHKSRK
jgi:lysophospholipase L1-like esterase